MKNRPGSISIICNVFLILLSACNLPPSIQHGEPRTEAENVNSAEQSVTQATPVEQAAVIKNDTAAANRQPMIEIGSGQYIGSPASKNAETDSDEDDITLNFQGTDINEFVKAILSDILNENFIIDPQVSGTVTIETSRPINKRELFPLLEEILAINNAAIIKSGGLYQILPRTKAIRGNLSPNVVEQSTGSGYSVKIVPLDYIAAREMQKILAPFISEGGNIRIDKQRNMIILAGTPQELSTLQETIEIFDVDWLRGMSVGLYPLNHVDPKSLKTELDAILGGTTDSSGNELLGGLIRTLPIERLNSILLISSTVAALRETEVWLQRLDRPGEQIGQHLYVYEVQNAKAKEIAGILGRIFETGMSDTTTSSDVELAPGTTPVEITNEGGAIVDSPVPPPATGNTTITAGSSGLSLISSKNVEIIADDTRNALVILATPKDYKMVVAAIQKLDTVPLQVLIEASILEVTLTGDLSYGVEWFFNNEVGRSRAGEGRLDLGAAGLNALAPGFSYTIVNSASNIKVALNALEKESEVNVLSAPSLMVLDNQKATINVGDEIPVPTRQSVSNINPDAPTVNEIQFRNTGVTLEVTPRVNNSGLVTMDIRQEVSNATKTESSTINAPTIQKRQIESTVAINSGQTIVLGGLIRDSETDNEAGIPGLYKLPLIGKLLFGNTSVQKRRTELIVLLTPRVVRNSGDANSITDEFRRKLQSLPPVNIHPKAIDSDSPS